jgi:hypothetical protein
MRTKTLLPFPLLLLAITSVVRAFDGRPYHYISDVNFLANLTLDEQTSRKLPISVNHYTTIGMPLEGNTAEDYHSNTMALLNNAILNDPKHLYRVPVGNLQDCHYVVYKSESGAQLWGTVHRKNAFSGFVPHFQGKSRVQLCLLSGSLLYNNNNDDDRCELCGDALDGSFSAVLDEQGHAYQFLMSSYKDLGGIQALKVVTQTQDGIVYAGFGFMDPDTKKGFLTLDMDCPNFGLLRQCIRSTPALIQVQLCLFAEYVNTYRSVQEYNESAEKAESGWASQCLGTNRFTMASETPNDNDNNNSYNRLFQYAHIVGHVLEAQVQTNEITGEPFYWALVRTVTDMEVDVVIHPTLLKLLGMDPPQVGGVIRCYGWVSGLIVGI